MKKKNKKKQNKIVKEDTPFLNPGGGRPSADSNWSRMSNKKSMKGKDIFDLLDIEDEQGPGAIQKPGALKMMDIVDSFYEQEDPTEQNEEEGEEDGESPEER